MLTPDSQSIIWIDPSGTTISTDNAPTLVSLGVYRSTVSLPAGGIEGTWTCRWTIKVGTDDEYAEYTFYVKEPN